MNQTKLESHIESTCNITTGFMISWLVWTLVVGPLVAKGVISPIHAGHALIITGIFTITSYMRSYFWRRFFATNLHHFIHAKVKEHYHGL